jgi:hypothetical protein
MLDKVPYSERPCERLHVTGATGLTPAQIATLKVLGASEESGEP